MLITGSSGFLGSKIRQMFPDAALCDRPEDFCDLRGVTGTVIHLAGWSNVAESVREPVKYILNNALNLAPFFANNDISRFIFPSTGGSIYGTRHLAQEADAAWERVPHPYAQSKWLAEQLIKAMVPSYCILRLSNVYQPGTSIVHKHFETDNPIVVYGDDVARDFVHIDVVAEAFKRAVINKVEGIYNIGSGVETNLLSLGNEYAAKRGVPVRLEPRRPGDTIDYLSLDCTAARNAGLM